MVTDVIIYTDGSNSPKYNVGAWAYIVRAPTGVLPPGKNSGIAYGTTNNAMELMAILRALTWANVHARGVNVCIRTDSKYAIGVIESDQSYSANSDLIRSCRAACEHHGSVRMEWVRGHAGDVWNVTVDRMCAAAAKVIIARTGIEAGKAKRLARRTLPI